MYDFWGWHYGMMLIHRSKVQTPASSLASCMRLPWSRVHVPGFALTILVTGSPAWKALSPTSMFTSARDDLILPDLTDVSPTSQDTSCPNHTSEAPEPLCAISWIFRKPPGLCAGPFRSPSLVHRVLSNSGVLLSSPVLCTGLHSPLEDHLWPAGATLPAHK